MQKWDMQNKMWLCGLWTDTKRLILLKNIRQIGVIYTLLFQRNDQKYVDSTLRVKTFHWKISQNRNFWKFRIFLGHQVKFKVDLKVWVRYIILFIVSKCLFTSRMSQNKVLTVYSSSTHTICHMISHMTRHMTCCVGHL